MNTSEEIIYLEQEIDKHDQAYWTGDETISDSEYEQLKIRLDQLDSDNPRLTKIQDVPLRGRKKIKHEIPMLSLAKVYSPEEVLTWAIKVARSENEVFAIQPKLDGIAARLYNRILSTRGNGSVGDDISSKIPLITIEKGTESGPLMVFNGDTDGEIVVLKSFFISNKDKFLRKDGSEYKNPRSMCIGIIGNDENPQITHQTGLPLRFIDYNTYSNMYTLTELKNLNLKDMCDNVQNNWDYPTDGLVIKLTDISYAQSLGTTSHHPRGWLSLKFENPRAETTLTHVGWQVGKQKISPVGIVETVNISGFDNTRMSLHNMKYIADNDLAIGDKIMIERCGEIIPQLHSIIERPDNRIPIQIPPNCPACGSETYYDEPDVKCNNHLCGGSLLKKLGDSVKRLGIDYLGEGTIVKMINQYNIKTIVDILYFDYDKALKLEGFGITSAQNLINEINKLKSTPIQGWRILSALNIPTISNTISQKIYDNISNLQSLASISIQQLMNIEGVGKERAQMIRDFFDIKSNVDQLIKMIHILTIEEKVQATNSPNGKICFTGKNKNPRSYWGKLAAKMGYQAVGSVTKDLKILVTDDIHSSRGKMKKANDLIGKGHNLKIMTYEQFKGMK